MNAPYKGCRDRSPTCHGNCERYREYRAERDKISEKRYREQAVISALMRKMVKIKDFRMKKMLNKG